MSYLKNFVGVKWSRAIPNFKKALVLRTIYLNARLRIEVEVEVEIEIEIEVEFEIEGQY